MEKVGVKQLLDKILAEECPKLEVALRNYTSSQKDYWSEWIKWTYWNDYCLKKWGNYREPNYRQVLENEIVFETDFPTKEENRQCAQKIMAKLKENDIGYTAVFTGNKSVHVHCYFKNLGKANSTQLSKTKDAIAKRILGNELYSVTDKANYKAKRLIQIEVADNPKTHASTELIEINMGNNIEILDCDVSDKPSFAKKKSEIINIKGGKIVDNGAPKYCAFLEYAAEHLLPAGNRHVNVDVNFAAYLNANPEKKDLYIRYHEKQKKHLSNGWVASDSQFNCKQLQNYSKSIGVTEPCKLCQEYNYYKTARLSIYLMKKKALKTKKT